MSECKYISIAYICVIEANEANKTQSVTIVYPEYDKTQQKTQRSTKTSKLKFIKEYAYREINESFSVLRSCRSN